mmetsp:Transcript_37225/g.61663  ORF Transcript_37225/g.61663 Transcript_37225/m.61663 type:complete len:113 (+) Transcript_37225:17-355(+)
MKPGGGTFLPILAALLHWGFKLLGKCAIGQDNNLRFEDYDDLSRPMSRMNSQLGMSAANATEARRGIRCSGFVAPTSSPCIFLHSVSTHAVVFRNARVMSCCFAKPGIQPGS